MPVIRIALILLLVGLILAIKFLPWYVWVVGVVVLVLGAKFIGKKLVLWLVSTPFRAKGAVLKGAVAEVHSIAPCEAPPVQERPRIEADFDEEEESEIAESDGPRSCYRLETTIKPKPSSGPFHHWEISELRLCPPDAKPMDDDSNACRVMDLKVFLDGQFVPDDEGYKLPGPQRLQLLIGVKPGVRRLAFQYYFEKFGEVVLPEEIVLSPSTQKNMSR